jgi:hypothetical protein
MKYNPLLPTGFTWRAALCNNNVKPGATGAQIFLYHWWYRNNTFVQELDYCVGAFFLRGA